MELLAESCRLQAKVQEASTRHEEVIADPKRGWLKKRIVHHWIRKQELGRGGFSVVQLEQNTATKQLRAVKVIDKKYTLRQGVNYLHELSAMAFFSKDGPRFPHFYGWYDDESHIYLAMEYFPMGDIAQCLSHPVTETEAQNLCWQLADALSLFHAHGMTHRDLKPENVFVIQRSPVWWVKLGDFGVSKRVKDDNTALRTQVLGLFVAPEVNGFTSLDDDDNDNDDSDDESIRSSYTSAVDIWALGCLAFWLLSLQVPFKSAKQLTRYCRGQSRLQMDLVQQNGLSKAGAAMIRSCLAPDYNQRPNIEDLKIAPWLEVVAANDYLMELSVGNPHEPTEIEQTDMITQALQQSTISEAAVADDDLAGRPTTHRRLGSNIEEHSTDSVPEIPTNTIAGANEKTFDPPQASSSITSFSTTWFDAVESQSRGESDDEEPQFTMLNEAQYVHEHVHRQHEAHLRRAEGGESKVHISNSSGGNEYVVCVDLPIRLIQSVDSSVRYLSDRVPSSRTVFKTFKFNFPRTKRFVPVPLAIESCIRFVKAEDKFLEVDQPYASSIERTPHDIAGHTTSLNVAPSEVNKEPNKSCPDMDVLSVIREYLYVMQEDLIPRAAVIFWRSVHYWGNEDELHKSKDPFPSLSIDSVTLGYTDLQKHIDFWATLFRSLPEIYQYTLLCLLTFLSGILYKYEGFVTGGLDGALYSMAEYFSQTALLPMRRSRFTEEDDSGLVQPHPDPLRPRFYMLMFLILNVSEITSAIPAREKTTLEMKAEKMGYADPREIARAWYPPPPEDGFVLFDLHQGRFRTNIWDNFEGLSPPDASASSTSPQ